MLDKLRSLFGFVLLTLTLCFMISVSTAQQSPPAADPAKAVEAVKTDAAKAPASGDKLANAIAKGQRGTGPGQIDDAKPKGYLGIPGGPHINLILAFCWALWVGWIFSTVGAFGGVMAGVGHISVYGLGSYAKSFASTAPDLGKMLTDSVKASNQLMAVLTSAVASFNYIRMGRVVIPLAISLGLGSLLGAFGVQYLTAGKVSFKAYQGIFGLFVLVLGAKLLYDMTPAAKNAGQTAKKAARAFEEATAKIKAGEKVDESQVGLKIQKFSATTCEFSFFGVPFKFNPIIPFIGGIIISAISAFLGVGGGFLLVPFLTSVTQLPMYLAAGTSALAVFVSMVTSIITLFAKGVTVEWSLVGIELAGVAVGSFIGPYTAKYLSDKMLKILFITLALYIGIGYTLAGFWGIKLPGV